MLLTVVDVSLAGVGGQGIWRGAPLAQTGAFQLEAMGAVNDAIQNGVAQGHVADDSGCARPGFSFHSPDSNRHDPGREQRFVRRLEYQALPARPGNQGSAIECSCLVQWCGISPSPNISALSSQSTRSAGEPKNGDHLRRTDKPNLTKLATALRSLLLILGRNTRRCDFLLGRRSKVEKQFF